MSHSQTQAYTEEDLARLVSVISYLTLIGWLVSLFIYGQHKSSLARFHVRQALGLIVTTGLLSFVPFIGWVLTLIIAVFWFIAMIHAYKGECYPIPVLGQFYQEHLDFIT
jgi:uncharacterized membrane protein